jgi:hypothetical protein
MATTAVIRVNSERSLCDIDLRPEGTPEDQFGEQFSLNGNEYPDSALFAFESDSGKSFLAVLQGAEIGVAEDTVYLVQPVPGGYMLHEVETEVEEIEDDDFDVDADVDADGDGE